MKVNFLECSSLTTLREGLGNLISLKELDLLGCSTLITSPEELGNQGCWCVALFPFYPFAITRINFEIVGALSMGFLHVFFFTYVDWRPFDRLQ